MLDRSRSVQGAALLAFRAPPDIFSGRGKDAARRKRDAAIPDTAEFDANGHLCVELRWRTGRRRQVRRDGAWVDLCVMPTDREES